MSMPIANKKKIIVFFEIEKLACEKDVIKEVHFKFFLIDI